MEELLTQLKLARIREVYRDWIDKASKYTTLQIRDGLGQLRYI